MGCSHCYSRGPHSINESQKFPDTNWPDFFGNEPVVGYIVDEAVRNDPAVMNYQVSDLVHQENEVRYCRGLGLGAPC